MTHHPVRRLPRVMTLARACQRILGIDRHEGYRLAREGKIPSVFRVGRRLFVSTLPMIMGMQAATELEMSNEEQPDEFQEMFACVDEKE